MEISTRAKVTAKRFLRVMAAVVVTGLLTLLTGPDALAIIPADMMPYVSGIVLPVLVALDKYLRFSVPATDTPDELSPDELRALPLD